MKIQTPADLSAKLLQVKARGFNVYAALYKVKRILKWPAQKRFPDEVVGKVCDRFLQELPQQRIQWAWFVNVLRQESAAYFSQQEIARHQEAKKPAALSLGQIFAMAQRNAENGITTKDNTRPMLQSA